MISNLEINSPLNEVGMCAFSIACSNSPANDEESKKNDKILHVISKNADVNSRDNFGRQPIHHAIKSGCVSTIRKLIELFYG